MPIRGTWARTSIWAAAIAIYLTLIAWGARGLRGSDQYWYATDLVMKRETGSAVSNFISPIVWSSPGWSPDRLPPPVHNIPVVHAAMTIDRLLNAEYLSWIVTNAMLAVGSTVLVYFIAQSLVSRTAATVAAALLLLSPQTIWYTLSPMAEQANVFFSMLLVWGTLQTQKRPWLGVVVMSGAAAMLVASRVNMFLVIPLGVVLCAVMAARKMVRWRIMWSFLGLSTCTYLFVSALLPQYPWKGISTVLALNTPADVNQLNWRLAFTVPEVELPWSTLLDKALSQLPYSIIPTSGADLITVTWALIALVFGLIAAPRQRNASLIKYWAVGFFGIYWVTSSLFLPQFRYAAPVTPLALILAIAGAERVIGPNRPRVLTVVAVTSGAAVTAASIVLTLGYRSSAEADIATLAAAKRMLATLPPGSTLYLETSDHGSDVPSGQRLASMQLSYTAAPRLVLPVVPSDPTPCVPTEVVNSWNVTSILVSGAASPELFRDVFCDPDSVGDMYVIPPPQGDPTGGYEVIGLTRE